MRGFRTTLAVIALLRLPLQPAFAGPPASSPTPTPSAASPITLPQAPASNALGNLLSLGVGASLTPVANSHGPDQYLQGGANGMVEGFGLSHYSPTGARDMVLCISGFATKPVETALVNQNFAVSGLTLASGGSGSPAVNDVVVMNALGGYAVGSANYYAPTVTATGVFRTIKVRVTSVSGSAVTGFEIIDPGLSLAPPSGTLTQASSSGSGTGLQLTVTGTTGYAAHMRFGIDPVYGGPAANVVPVTWNGAQILGTFAANSNAKVGNQDGLVQNGQTGCSDPATVNIPPGGKFNIRVWHDGYIPGGYILGNGGDGASRGITAADVTANTAGGYSVSTPTTTLINLVGPSLILGTPYKVTPIWGLSGDSIEFGNSTGGQYAYDLGNANNCQGWFVRAACTNGTPVVSEASAGNQISYLFANNAYNYAGSNTFTITTSGYGLDGQFSLFAKGKITDFFDGLGVNDTTANISAAIIIANKQKLYTLARSRLAVQKVATMTLFPHAGLGGPATGCQEASISTWTIGGTNTNGESIYNALARDGLIAWNGTAGGTWDNPLGLGWTIGASPVSTGAQTVTPSAMTKTGAAGGVFSILPGASIMVNPGAADQEIVTPTATNGTVNAAGYPTTLGSTFTATFTKAHAAGEPMIVYSPLAYYPGINAAGSAQSGLYPSQTLNPGGVDFVVDHSPYTESATGSCQWVSPVSTTTTAAITTTGSQSVPLASISGTFQGTTFAIGVNSSLILDSGGSAESVTVTAVSGNSVTIAPTMTHASGVAIGLKLTNDGTHPTGDGPGQVVIQGHTWIAQNAAPQLAANQ